MQNTSENDTTKIHPAIAQTIIRTVESYGVDPRIILVKLGMNTIADLNQHKRLNGSKIDDVWRASVEVTKDDAIGVKFASHFQLGSLNGLGFSWMVSNTLLDGFSRISRFFGVISSAGKIEVKEEKSAIRIVLALPVPYGIAENAGIDAALALFVQLCRSARGDEVSPLCINMQRPEPSSVKAFDDFFQCEINYNSSQNELVFATDEMLRALPIANPDLARANDQVVMDYLRKYQVESTVGKVSSIVIESLPSGAPTIKSIADQLFMSTKTLQRRLKAEGLTFSSLLDNTRISLATNYLKQDWRSMGEICYLLGFTEPSNFTRWFKSETGESPAEFRRTQKAES